MKGYLCYLMFTKSYHESLLSFICFPDSRSLFRAIHRSRKNPFRPCFERWPLLSDDRLTLETSLSLISRNLFTVQTVLGIRRVAIIILLLRNALGNMQTSQEYFTTIVYAKFGGQTECIMDNWKIVNAWRLENWC